jgi:hypothetical protein
VLARAGALPSDVVALVAAAFLPWALVCVSPPALERRRAVLVAMLLALGTGVVLVAAPPLLSDDVYRYLWDARVLSHGIDPYRWAPSDPHLAWLRDEAWAHVNNPEIPTIYPPLAQVAFALADGIAHAPWAFKALALAAHVACIPLVARLAGPERGGTAALLFGVHPLALVESALSGHVDAAVGLAVAAFALALVLRRGVLAAVIAGVASGLKLVGLVLAPLVAREGGRRLALALLLALLPVGVLASAGHEGDAPPGVGQYAQRWRGNAGLYALVESATTAWAYHAGMEMASPPGHVRLPEALRPLLERLEGTPLDPWATVLGEKKEIPDRLDFSAEVVGSLLARVLVALFVLALVVWLVHRRVEPLWALRFTLLLTLLLAPTLHPWYVLWLLPIELACGGAAGLVLSATVLLAYDPLDAWQSARVWHEHPLAVVLEHGLVLAVFSWELLRGRSEPIGVVSEAGSVTA